MFSNGFNANEGELFSWGNTAFYGAADGTAPLYGLTEPEEIEGCPGASEAQGIIRSFNVESLSCVDLVKVDTRQFINFDAPFY